MSETKRVLLAERGRGVLLTTECRCLIQTSVARGEERRGVVERCASLSVGIFCLFCFEDGMQMPETKECCYWRGKVCFTSCGFVFFFVLRTECRCLKQKSVARGEGWLKCLFLYLWVFCFVFEDGMQIPETKVCC